MRVLLLSEQCNPEWPSLPVVGYKTALTIADEVETVLVTHVRNRENIEKHGHGRAEMIYIDNESVARPLHRLATVLRGGSATGWTTGVALDYPSYLAFERQAWKACADRLRRGEFDLVHRVTPMSPTLPSPMAKRSPVPFLLGPLNGGLAWPTMFTEELKREREWLSYLRGAYRFLPYHNATFRHAAGILAAFQHTIDDLPASCRDKAMNFPEVGIDPSLFDQTEPRAVRDRKTVLYVGRLVPYKLPEVAVRAFAVNPKLRRHKLMIVGKGPELPRLERIVEEHGLQGCVEFAGWKTQAEVGQLMRTAEILSFPSIRELGAGVVVEAMACGMACVVVDYGGPGGLIDADRGIKVPLGDRDALIDRFAAEIGDLIDDDARIERLGRAAREHAMIHYAWSAKARKTVAIYEWLLGKRDTRPCFEDAPEPAQPALCA